MFSRRNIRRLQSVARAATSWLLLGAYIAVAAGVPMPAPSSEVADGTPFPCQGGRCGCRTAEQCWKSCCCNTPTQRLAWAERNGVTPPSYVIAAAAAEQILPAVRSCCASKKSKQPTRVSSCGDAACTHNHSAGEPACAATKPSPVTWVSLLDVQRCRGTTPTWHNVPISLPPQPPVNEPNFEPLVAPLVLAVPPSPPAISFVPPVPPPRIG